MYLTTAPLPFAPLWETFFNGSSKELYNVYVHADPTREYDPPFSGVFENRVIHSKPSERNTPTLASAARRLIAHALLDDPQNYMFALFSPSCYPFAPLTSLTRRWSRIARASSSYSKTSRCSSKDGPRAGPSRCCRR